MTVWNPSLFFLWYCYESIILPLVGAHKYVWLTSPDRPDFCSKVRAGWSAPIKTKNKLKGRFISINHLLVIEISIFLTWDNFKGYVPTESNLELLWQWLAAWKLLKSGSHVSWRGLCFCHNLVLQIFEITCRVPKAFYLSCHKDGLENRISWISA